MAESGSIIPSGRSRLDSIDMLRGLVLVIMALDHVRDMVTHPLSANYSSAVDFTASAGALFFTRWITHICAPTFVLLAGVSAFLYGAKRGRPTGDIGRFLLSRGVWLIFMELTVISFAWAFNLRTLPFLQVIWAIGWSMIALAGLVYLPKTAIGVVGILMIVVHNGLDYVQPLISDASPAWVILHIPGPLTIGGAQVANIIYPLIPWIGVMAVGYAIGSYFMEPNTDRPKRLFQIGLLLTFSFLLLRAMNIYGEPVKWDSHSSAIATLISFFSVTKYPPSLHYLLMTLGPAFMLLGWFEKCSGKIAERLIIIGRVSFFYYVIHLYLIHTIAIAIGLWQGFSLRDMTVLFLENPANFGISLGGVYIVWGIIVLAIYPACVWFAGIKARRRDWWLKYL